MTVKEVIKQAADVAKRTNTPWLLMASGAIRADKDSDQIYGNRLCPLEVAAETVGYIEAAVVLHVTPLDRGVIMAAADNRPKNAKKLDNYDQRVRNTRLLMLQTFGLKELE